MSDGVMVTRLEDQNYKIVSCYQVTCFENETLSVDEEAIDILFEPITSEYKESLIKKAKLKLQDFVTDASKKPAQITVLDIKNIAEYKLAIHKVTENISFAFLIQPLTDSEFKKIEKESPERTLLTGDPDDLFVKKEDFKH